MFRESERNFGPEGLLAFPLPPRFPGEMDHAVGATGEAHSPLDPVRAREITCAANDPRDGFFLFGGHVGFLFLDSGNQTMTLTFFGPE